MYLLSEKRKKMKRAVVEARLVYMFLDNMWDYLYKNNIYYWEYPALQKIKEKYSENIFVGKMLLRLQKPRHSRRIDYMFSGMKEEHVKIAINNSIGAYLDADVYIDRTPSHRSFKEKKWK